jgi:hypothetical protein
MIAKIDQFLLVVEGLYGVMVRVMLWLTANRGTTMITFIAGGAQRAFPSYDGSWSRLFSNYKVPKQTNTCACQSFDFPTTGGDKHIVAIRPVIQPGNEAYPHHAILHVCQQNGYLQTHNVPTACLKNTLVVVIKAQVH